MGSHLSTFPLFFLSLQITHEQCIMFTKIPSIISRNVSCYPIVSQSGVFGSIAMFKAKIVTICKEIDNARVAT